MQFNDCPSSFLKNRSIYTEERHNKCGALQWRIRDIQSEILKVNARIVECKMDMSEYEILMKSYHEHVVVLSQLTLELMAWSVPPINLV